MKKILSIGSCNEADYRLAEIALFERLQAYFNLHPGKMAKVIKDVALKYRTNEIKFAQQLKAQVEDEFEHALNTARSKVDRRYKYTGKLCDGRAYSSDSFSREMQHFFNLDPKQIIRDVTAKYASEDLKTADVLQSMEYQIGNVIEWAFTCTVKILKKK